MLNLWHYCTTSLYIIANLCLQSQGQYHVPMTPPNFSKRPFKFVAIYMLIANFETTPNRFTRFCYCYHENIHSFNPSQTLSETLKKNLTNIQKYWVYEFIVNKQLYNAHKNQVHNQKWLWQVSSAVNMFKFCLVLKIELQMLSKISTYKYWNIPFWFSWILY